MKHLKEKKVSYIWHLIFAAKVAARLCLSAIMFLVHGICPLIFIPRILNLDSLANDLFRWSDQLENKKRGH